MKTKTSLKNWALGSTSDILAHIHQPEVNIAIYNRDTDALSSEVNSLVEEEITVKASGNRETLLLALADSIQTEKYPLLTQDITGLLELFQTVTTATSMRFLLATVNTNMCKRFHTDANDVRMLCTYSGQGTLWLKEEDVNRDALSRAGGNDAIVWDEQKIQQAETGSVLLLKGALYPQDEVHAIVHRSPTLTESGEKRLLLRVDTNQFLSF